MTYKKKENEHENSKKEQWESPKVNDITIPPIYDGIIKAALKKIQEQEVIIKDLKEEIENLKRRSK